MCSIIGYYGQSLAAPVLVKGLKRMEYRGYDSVGVATKAGEEISLRKGIGKVSEVNQSKQLDQMSGNIGIGHTRWATHGKVTDTNAHPHSSNKGDIVIVHNGIIENYVELKKDLEQKGFEFKSDTDTEVVANKLQENLLNTSIKDAIIKTLEQLDGHYAFVVMFKDGTLAAARYHEPLIIGVGKDSHYLSSDVLGFIEQTDDAMYIDSGEFVIINKDGLQVYDFDGTPVKKQITKVSKEFADAYKGDYAHYTLKEISEQPDTILVAGANTKDVIKNASQYMAKAKSIYITGSGTSYNAALVAQYLMSKYAKIKIEPIISSEMPYSPISMEQDSILITISQSGESADVIEAANIAKKSGARVYSIVNLLTSALVQESDLVMGMNCGPEIGVAATKSFTSQLGVIYKIVEDLSEHSIDVDWDEISKCMTQILSSHTQIQNIAKELKDISDIYVLGRGIHYPIASEAALKLKELTYMHAEGIPGGELKHGPLALMDSNVYVIIINPKDSTYSDTLTSAQEIKARGAKIIGISDENSDVYDHWIKIPKINDVAYPIIEIIPVQLLSYYSALEKDADPDYPRNLAKSVTVK